jgi:hypothetical protein
MTVIIGLLSAPYAILSRDMQAHFSLLTVLRSTTLPSRRFDRLGV